MQVKVHCDKLHHDRLLPPYRDINLITSAFISLSHPSNKLLSRRKFAMTKKVTHPRMPRPKDTSTSNITTSDPQSKMDM